MVLGMHSSFLSLDQYSGGHGVHSAAPVAYNQKDSLQCIIGYINKINWK